VAPAQVHARVRESARRARCPKSLRARPSALARTHAPTSARSLVPTHRHRLAVAACASSLPFSLPRPPLRPSLPAQVFASTSRSFVMAVDMPAGSSPPADAVPRTNQDGRAAGGSSSAPARVVGGSSGSGASGSGAAEGLVQAKSSSTTLFPFVRVGIVKLWHDTVNERARRHQSRGVSKRLQGASISAHLVNTNKWVRRLRVDGKPMDKAAVSHLITKAVALYNVTNTIKMHNTGTAADYVEGRVKKRVGEQGEAWGMSYEEANKNLKFVADTVGGSAIGLLWLLSSDLRATQCGAPSKPQPTTWNGRSRIWRHNDTVRMACPTAKTSRIKLTRPSPRLVFHCNDAVSGIQEGPRPWCTQARSLSARNGEDGSRPASAVYHSNRAGEFCL